MLKTLVIVPAYNEENTLEDVITDIKTNAPGVDYLVVNDCSSDESVRLLKRLGAEYIDCPVNLGIGGAVQAGYKYALKNGYEVAIQFDGDGQHVAEYIPEMVKEIEDGKANVVIGSRFIAKEGFQSSMTRRIGIRVLSGLIFLMCGKHIKDVTSGFRAVDTCMMKAFADNYPDDYPEPEVIVTSVLSGVTIKEIPVLMRDRVAGKSSINLKKSIYYMIKVSLAIVVCRISLGVRRDKKNKQGDGVNA